MHLSQVSRYSDIINLSKLNEFISMRLSMLFIAIFLSTSAISANQCQLDDICLSFKTDKNEFSVSCRDISSVSITSRFQSRDSISIEMSENIDMLDFVKQNQYTIATFSILGYEYDKLRLDSYLKNKVRIPLNNSPKLELINKLIDCVHLLNK